MILDIERITGHYAWCWLVGCVVDDVAMKALSHRCL